MKPSPQRPPHPPSMPKSLKRFWDKEFELSKSWDKYRVTGLRLTYPKLAKRIPWFFVALMCGGMFVPFAVFVLTEPPPAPEDVLPTILALVVVFFVLLLVPLMLFMTAYGGDVEVTSAGPKSLPLLRRGVSASWDEIQSIVYSEYYKRYIVHTTRGDIRVAPGLQGIGFFIEMAMEHVPLDKRLEWKIPFRNLEFFVLFGPTNRRRWLVDHTDSEVVVSPLESP